MFFKGRAISAQNPAESTTSASITSADDANADDGTAADRLDTARLQAADADDTGDGKSIEVRGSESSKIFPLNYSIA